MLVSAHEGMNSHLSQLHRMLPYREFAVACFLFMLFSPQVAAPGTFESMVTSVAKKMGGCVAACNNGGLCVEAQHELNQLALNLNDGSTTAEDLRGWRAYVGKSRNAAKCMRGLMGDVQYCGVVQTVRKVAPRVNCDVSGCHNSETCWYISKKCEKDWDFCN